METALRTQLEALRAQVNEIRRIAPNQRTAEQWRTIAKEASVSSAESYERCDSDGFLSQWASNQMATRYHQLAQAAEEGYTTAAMAVFDLEGNLVSQDYRDGQYGPYWFIRQAEGKARFFSESNADKLSTRRANNAKKGYRLGEVRVKVDVTEYDCTRTDQVVEVISTDLFADWLNAGRTHYWAS